MILVTGAAGGIGSVLLERLLELGHHVVAIDDLSSGSWSNVSTHSNLKIETGSILDEKFLTGLPWESVTAVIHLAATSSLPGCQIDPEAAFSTNFLGTVGVAEFARKRSPLKVFINASTSAVYEGLDSSVLTEDLQVRPHLVYSQSKVFAEHYLSGLKKTTGFPSVSFRFFNVFGPMQDYKRVSPPLLNYITRELYFSRLPVLHSDGHQKRDYISVGDVCSALLAALEKSTFSEDVYNLCSGVQLSVNEILEIAKATFGINVEPEFRAPELLWSRYSALFTGSYPLKKEIVAAETNKTSLGSSVKFSSETGWVPNPDVAHQLANTFTQAWKHIELKEQSR
jgi:UDP-glucose 4-epimerase